MIEFTPELAEAIPSTEIGRWAARINRINYALAEEKSIHVGGSMSDDGQIIWELGVKAAAGKDWQVDPWYEDAVLYELKPDVRYDTVAQALEPDEAEVELTAEMSASDMVGRVALCDGLQRTGILIPDSPEDESVTVSPGALAALCLQRADIKETVDRGLFDRKAEIDAITTNLESITQPRGLGTSEPGFEDYRASVYRASSYAEDGLLQKLGATTRRGLWWQELQRDFGRIDEASKSLSDNS